jgi:hypothetical protein
VYVTEQDTGPLGAGDGKDGDEEDDDEEDDGPRLGLPDMLSAILGNCQTIRAAIAATTGIPPLSNRMGSP